MYAFPICFIMMFPGCRFSVVVLLGLAFVPVSGHSAGEKLSFNRDVQPILAEYCYHCHGPDAGTRMPANDPLRLDIEEFAIAIRDGGPQAIIPGNGAGSEVVKRMRSKDPQEVMPPPEMPHVMNMAQIAIIERWIDEGAEYEPHWSFVKPERPEPPAVDGPWGTNPIDAFLHAEMSRHGLAPNPPEDPARLFRRVTLDLTGLPPTPDDVRAFLEDPSADAYESAVDRMLDTPAHAEQMARYWLDAARYADTHGIHIDNFRAIWPYRDWVVAAFRENMPFDQFSIEQLAGDMLPEATLEQKIASGFNRCLPTTGEGGAINEEYEAIYQMDRVETTAGVWMGLTMACAACHDHKFDPITAEDYFAFAAFFRNTTMHPMDRNHAEHPPNIFAPLPEDRQLYAEIEGRLRELQGHMKARAKAVEPDVAARLSGLSDGNASEIPTDGLALTAADGNESGRGKPATDHFIANQDESGKMLREERDRLKKKLDEIRSRGSVTLIMEEKPGSEPATRFLERGDYQSPAHLVKANTPVSLPPLPEGTRADRLAMAKWLFDPEHPLTARVAANRMWAKVFGEGIVATTGDFGLMGERPSHPELLDWLAVEFVESGWDQRHIYRLIFTSQAYRQSAAWTEEKAEADPENRLLARGPRLRLDAEVLRDMALSAAGLLIDRAGGPPVKPYQPEGVWEAVAMKESNTRFYKQDQGDALYRRSLYTLWKRTAPHPAMEIFNAPSREVFCTKRERTNTPLQALVLMNDPQFVEACRVLAESVLALHETDTARLQEIMMRLLARGPDKEETEILSRSLDDFLKVFRGDPESAKRLLGVGEAPRRENLDPAVAAAWTLIASQILNTDECVTR